MREISEHGVFLDPQRGARLYVLDEARKVLGGMKAREYVQMIFGPIDAVLVAIAIFKMPQT